MKEGILQCVFKSAKRLHMDWLSDIIQQSNSDPSRAPTMELEFEGIPVHEQIDMYINGTRGDFYAYTEMPWDLPYNGNEGLDLSSFSLELDEAPSEKATAEDSDLLLMQASNSESPDVKQLQQDSNDNDCPPTNSTRIHCISSQGKLCSRSSNDDAAKKSESSSNNHQSQPESGPKRKAKLCWTPELHGLFVKAVEQLGHDRAVPTKILELMDIPSLNRHHIASHLQKYRSSIRGLHRKPRKTQQRMCCNTKRSHVLKSCPAKVERPHSYAPAYNVPFWPPTHFSVPPAEAFSMQMCNRQAADPWLLQQSNYKSSVHATALGTAVYEQSLVGFPTQLHDCAAEFKEAVCSVDFEAHINSTAMCVRPKAAAVEEAIRQVMNQRCSQLPIGLTPPSAESLTAELLKQRVPHEVLTSSSDF